MNIFAYDPCPKQSALWLDDIRKNKMILEGCQVLSSTVAMLKPEWAHRVYKITHQNHPCSVWTRGTAGNFSWLLTHTEALYDQRGRTHASSRLFPVFREFISEHSDAFMFEEQTPFANCARNKDLGIDYTGVSDTHKAYRLYTTARWAVDTIKLSWNHGEKPNWNLEE